MKVSLLLSRDLRLAYLQLEASLSALVSVQQGCRQAPQAKAAKQKAISACHSPRSDACDTWVARGGKCRALGFGEKLSQNAFSRQAFLLNRLFS